MPAVKPQLKMICLLLAILTASGCASLAPRRVTMKSLLNEMTDHEAVARWPEPSFTVNQASSYDRHTQTPADPSEKGWFANGDHSQFVRDEERQGVKEHVLMDVDGPGCLVRLWFTAGNTDDTIRVYLDGAAEPAIQATLRELFQDYKFVDQPLAIQNAKIPGRKQPGGMNLFLPIPYARHCKVTWSDGVKQSRYYNLEYRTYPQGTAVETFTPAALAALKPLLTQVNKTLLAPAPAKGTLKAVDYNLAPGHDAALALPDGPAAVRQLELKLTLPEGGSIENALRTTIMYIIFDGQQTVWAPVGDFFGSGVGLNPLHNWYSTVEKDGTLRCRWVMPYRQAATLTLVNLGKQRVAAHLGATTGKWKWDDRSLYFHATWRQERGIPTRPFKDWNYVNISGRGIYMGDALAVYNPVKGWWGEGDEKIYQDGEAFPSHIGTGSEDYYGYAWCSPVLFQGPFSNQSRVDGPANQGHTAVSRVRDLDRLTFNKSLRFDIEVWHWNKDVKVNYAATSWWYGAPGATCNVGLEPGEATAPIPAK